MNAPIEIIIKLFIAWNQLLINFNSFHPFNRSSDVSKVLKANPFVGVDRFIIQFSRFNFKMEFIKVVVSIELESSYKWFSFFYH